MTVVFDEVAHEYMVDGVKVPSVTNILSLLNDFDGIPMAILHNAALRGTEVHRLTEQYDKGIDEDTDERHAPYVHAWVQFRKDTGFRPLYIEERVYHPEEGYCGTLDRVGVLNGRLCVVDIKSSVKLGPLTGLQLAAYQGAWNYMHPESAPATHRYAVRVGKDGKYEVREYADWDDWAVFLSALHLHNWSRRVGA